MTWIYIVAGVLIYGAYTSLEKKLNEISETVTRIELSLDNLSLKDLSERDEISS